MTHHSSDALSETWTGGGRTRCWAQSSDCLSGLLGIGGGAAMVPVLAFIFKAVGFAPDHVVHLALGTSIASILFTSASSVRSHHLRRAVNWGAVRIIAPSVMAGTLGGALLAGYVDARCVEHRVHRVCICIGDADADGYPEPVTGRELRPGSHVACRHIDRHRVEPNGDGRRDARRFRCCSGGIWDA